MGTRSSYFRNNRKCMQTKKNKSDPPEFQQLHGRQTTPALMGPWGEWLVSQLDSPMSRYYAINTPCAPSPPIAVTLARQQESLLWAGCYTPIWPYNLQVLLRPETLPSLWPGSSLRHRHYLHSSMINTERLESQKSKNHQPLAVTSLVWKGDLASKNLTMRLWVRTVFSSFIFFSSIGIKGINHTAQFLW